MKLFPCNHMWTALFFSLIHWTSLALEYETTEITSCRQQHDCLPMFCLVQKHIHILFSVSVAWNIIWKMHISNPLIALSKHFAQELCYINSLKCLGQNIIWWRHSSGLCILLFFFQMRSKMLQRKVEWLTERNINCIILVTAVCKSF